MKALLLSNLNNTNNKASFENDYKQMLALYYAMVDSPLIPSIADLPWTDVASKQATNVFEVKEFVPKIPKITEAGKKEVSVPRAYSKQSDKVGREGEKFVFEYEKKKLEELGRVDLAN